MIFTVHERGEEVVLVADERSIWAFVFGGFWLLWHGVWVIGALWLGFTFALQWLGEKAGDAWPQVTLLVLLGLLLPRFWLMLEGAAVRRWSLRRKGFALTGVVEAPSREEAEVVHAWRTLRARERDGNASGDAPLDPVASAAQEPRTPRPRGEEAFGLVPIGR